MKYIPINNGYYNCKSINDEIFRSVYSKTSIDSQPLRNVDRITYENKTYNIGVGKPSLSKDKTDTDATKLFVLNMLGRIMGDTECEKFKLYLTAPPISYSEQRLVLADYLEGNHTIVHNGMRKNIIIDEVKVYPETVSAYLANNPAQFKRDVIILDIGGVTSNGALIRPGGQYDAKEDVFSIYHGMYNIENSICEYLNSKYYKDIHLCIENIPQVLKEGLYLGSSKRNIIESERVQISKFYYNFVAAIQEKIELKGWMPSACDIILTGGGSYKMQEYIQQRIGKHARLGINPIFDNLNGLKLIANAEEKMVMSKSKRRKGA